MRNIIFSCLGIFLLLFTFSVKAQLTPTKTLKKQGFAPIIQPQDEEPEEEQTKLDVILTSINHVQRMAGRDSSFEIDGTDAGGAHVRFVLVGQTGTLVKHDKIKWIVNSCERYAMQMMGQPGQFNLRVYGLGDESDNILIQENLKVGEFWFTEVRSPAVQCTLIAK